MSSQQDIDVNDEVLEVDLSNLIDLSMSFQPLQLNLQRILKRVRYLEGDNQVKTQQIRDLQDALSKLQQKDQGEQEDHDAIWEELERLGDLIGDLQGEAQRPTIEQLYHARKEKEGNERRTPVSSAGSNKRGELEAGETILDKAREQLPVSAEEFEGEEADEADDVQGAEDAEEEDDGGERANNASSGRDDNASSSKPNSASVSNPSKRLQSAEDGETTPADGVAAMNSESFGRKEETTTEMESELSKQHGDLADKSESPGGSAGSKRSPTKTESAKDISKGPRRPSRAASGKSSGSRRPASNTGVRRGGSGKYRGDDRSAESSTAMSPSRRSLGNSQSGSVFDKLKRDGDDISYLNRVVAEILAEMKGLHSDVDLLRTLNGAEGEEAVRGAGGSGGSSGHGKGKGGLSASGLEAGDLDEDDIEKVKEQLRKAGALTSDDIEAVKNLSDNQDRMREMEKLVRAMEKQNERLRDKLDGILEVTDGTTEINPTQFGLMAGTVKSLEKQLDDLFRSGMRDWTAEFEDMQNQLRKLQRDLDEMKERLQRTERTTKRLEDKGGRVGFAPGTNGEGGEGGADGINAAALQLSDDLWRRLEEINDRLDNTESEVKRLDDEKADRHAMQRLRDDLQNLKRLMDLNAKRDAGRLNIDGEGGDAGETKALFQELQQQLLAQMKNSNNDKEQAREEMNNLMEFVRQLDHRKADATLVANKAERDYVENALERLMREVEQVLNATNAGLIDTLDKSLNILRDMIDAKATKQDIARLQQLMEEEGGGKAAADGPMGFKGYRCLGCNRPVDSMRPRNMPPNMDQFLNRNPQTYPQDGVTRNIQQQQQATALLEQHNAIQ